MFFIGDLHFGHEKVAKIRGFDSVEQHDLFIFDQWNKIVREDDKVYVLGDISGGRDEQEYHALEILAQLPGYKTLICGNHDSVSGIQRKYSSRTEHFRQVFERIQDFGRIRMENTQILLSHYPYTSQGDGPGRGEARYREFRLPDTGGLLIHAHTHHTHPTNGSVKGRELCVSWDARRGFTTTAHVSEWVKSTL